MIEENKDSKTLKDLPRGIQIAVSVGREKKAEGIVVLTLSAITSFTDYFIIMHGNSSKQLIALSEGIERGLRTERIKPLSIEGKKNAEWILLDYGSFVVHLFTREKRDYYSLERLWADVPRLDVSSEDDQ